MIGFKKIILPLGFVLISYVFGVFVFGIFAPNEVRPFDNLSFRRPAYGHLLKRTNEAETIEDIDILILGSSHAYRGFDPRVFKEHGIKIFNFGSSSQSPIQSEYLCKKYLDKMRPELVIVETYPILFSKDGVESTLDLISNTTLDLAAISLIAKTPDPRAINNYLFRLIANATGKKREYQPINKNSDSYILGGYVEQDSDEIPLEKQYEEITVKILPKQSEALKNIVDYCSKKNVKILLVQAPVTNNYYTSIKGMESFDQEMKNLAPYFNYNQKIPLIDNLHFHDGHHLNQHGVELFNQSLIKKLQEEKMVIQIIEK